MASKTPIQLKDGRSVEVQKFVEDGAGQNGEFLIAIDGQHYRVFRSPDNSFYSMTKLGGHMTSVKGTYDELVLKLVRIHMAWRDYEKAIQRSKNIAASARDQAIHQIIAG